MPALKGFHIILDAYIIKRLVEVTQWVFERKMRGNQEKSGFGLL